MKRLEGILVALPYPFTKEGDLDRQTLERHTRDLLDAGVHGFWINGLTGCGIYLKIQQRQRILESVMELVTGRVPVLAMVSAMSAADGTGLAEHAGKLGVTGVSALPPLVYPTGLAEIAEYLKSIQDAAGLPMSYYHVPALTKVELNASQLAQLCERVPLAAIKYSEIDFLKAIEVLQRCPKAVLLTGFEDLLLGSLALRCASGTVGSMQNFIPRPLVELFEAFQRNDLVRAEQLQAGIARVSVALARFDYTAAAYGILNLLGYNYRHPVPPMKRLSEGLMAELKAALLTVVRPDPFQEGRLIESRDLLFQE